VCVHFTRPKLTPVSKAAYKTVVKVRLAVIEAPEFKAIQGYSTYIPHFIDASLHCVSNWGKTIKDQWLIYSFRSTGLRLALEPGFFQSVAGTCGSS